MAGHSFKAIAANINRHPSTISREIRTNRNFITARVTLSNDCALSSTCTVRNLCNKVYCSQRCCRCDNRICREYCDRYQQVNCLKLNCKPYVCNICKQRTTCKRTHAYYNAHVAHKTYLHNLSSSRQGIRVSPAKLRELDALITPRLMRGQSLSHIFSTHGPKIGCSKKTIYNYIEAHAFSAKNIDLPRKVRYKRRKLHYQPRMHYKYRVGRTYEDFKAYLAEHPELSVVEMDTVIGKREKGKVLLTMIFVPSSFMLIFLLPDKTQKSVIAVFDGLTKSLGINLFRKIFPVILTDNGVEFKDVHALEYTANGAERTKLFYCDPQASWQKPHIEKNHEFIRYVIPKGQTFSPYDQPDMTLLANHINSYSREALGGKCPYDVAKDFLGKKMLNHLELSLVSPDEVLLKPKLLKH